MFLFAIGVVLILDAAFGHKGSGASGLDRVVEVIVALLLLGVLPVGAVLDRFFGRRAAPPAEP